LDEISRFRLTKSAGFVGRNQPVSPDEISRFYGKMSQPPPGNPAVSDIHTRRNKPAAPSFRLAEVCKKLINHYASPPIKMYLNDSIS
jgi:hypothetical protein